MQVQEAIAGCWTGQIDRLTQQLLNRLLVKGYLVQLDHPHIVCEGRHNNPYLQPQAYEALIKAVEYKEETIVISSCLRSVPQQYMLRKQYELGICSIPAAAYPGRSQHQSGTAIDIPNNYDWKFALEKFGWQWRGAWDRYHFNFPGLLNLGALQVQEWQRLWNEYNPNDLLKVDGDCGKKTQRTIAIAPIEGFGNDLLFQVGDINKKVGRLQILLRETLGISPIELIADCRFGKQTTKAVMQFQQLKNLPITGICDRKTLKALGYQYA